MSAKATPFADNWAYLKTELGWLERLLLTAVAKRRQENREVNRIAQSPADRVTSHWWKGIITLNQPAFHDDCRVPAKIPGSAKQSYQQLLEARIQASQSQGIALGLPALCDRFGLSTAEKNLVLLALAPEVNQRYGKLYRYLQADSSSLSLPTVDLSLRLLCRNDLEWRRLRAKLAAPTSFVYRHLLAYQESAPLIESHLQLSPELVNYLLAETPQPQDLPDIVLPRSSAIAPPDTTSAEALTPWPRLELELNSNPDLDLEPRLVLPEALIQSLQGLAQQTALSLRLSGQITAPQGQIVLLSGPAGTGKTYAAKAIARSLNQPLITIDLAHLTAAEQTALLLDKILQTAPLILLRTAQHWLGRQTKDQTKNQALICHWLAQRRQVPGLTLFTTHFMQSVRPSCRRQLDGVLEFPLPDERQRSQLWQQILPESTQIEAEIDWSQVARLVLTGGEIQAIAQTALAYAQAADTPTLRLQHLQQAAALRGKTLRLKR